MTFVVLGGGDGNGGGGDGKATYWVMKRRIMSGYNVSFLRIPRGYARTLALFSASPCFSLARAWWRVSFSGGVRLDAPAVS